MDDTNINHYITREELMNKSKIGIHKVTDKPITGYKVAFFKLRSEGKPSLYDVNNPHNFCILELEIPIGALIVRPFESSRGDYIGPIISNKLRTDRLFVKSIESMKFEDKLIKKQLSLNDCYCYSYWDNSYEYTDQEMRPESPLSHCLNSNCESGLHFFLHKENAEKYVTP